LTLLAIEDVLGQHSCWFIWARVVKMDIEGIVLSGRGVVGKEWETQIIGVFVLLLVVHVIVIDRRV